MSGYGDFVTFGPDANCTLDLCPISTSVYEYRPSLAANITFIALFAIAMVIHIILGFRWKQWWYMACMVVGCIDEIMGYAGRIWLYYSPWKFEAFMIQIVTLTTGPVFYCAAIYVVLAKTITAFGPEHSRFPPQLFYWVFIPCDLVSLALQGAGGGMSTTSSGTNQIGVNLALAGLGFQVFTLVVFSGLYIDYVVRHYRRTAAGFTMRLKLFFGFIGLAIVLTLARCAYRVDELSQGYDGPLISDEGLFIGLEGVLIVCSVYCLTIGHPGLVFGRTDEKMVYDAEMSGTESGSRREK